jgi:AP-3 complex subunit beta
MTAARVIYYAGPPAYLQKTVNPLLKLLHKSREVERVVLVYLLIIVQKMPVRCASMAFAFLTRSINLTFPVFILPTSLSLFPKDR